MSVHNPHHHHHHDNRNNHHSSSFPSCFRPSTTKEDHHQAPPPPPPPPQHSGNPNLTNCLYHTHRGLFSLIWSRSFLGHSLHLHFHPTDEDPFFPSSPVSLSNPLPLSTLSFHLTIKPFTFWRKHGSKKLTAKSGTTPEVQIFWDLSRARFGSRPEPQSGFFIAVVFDEELTLLIGDCSREAYARVKNDVAETSCGPVEQLLVLRREHVFGNRVYVTKARFGGKNRDISIDCRVNEESKLCFSIDGEKVLEINRLKWKFRGNERIEVDGIPIEVSWDVYNWMFDEFKNKNNNMNIKEGHAVFMFRFENLDYEEENKKTKVENGVVISDRRRNSWSLGMNGIEWRKMRKGFTRSGRSSSSSSMSSSSSSGCSSSVMEWANMEESELSSGPTGFSLLVYAWKK